MAIINFFPVIDLPATGRSIERRRKESGLSVRDIQTYFEFEYPQAVYKWQHGECLPSVDNQLALSWLLKVPMEDLLVYEDQEVHVFWLFFCIKILLARVRDFAKSCVSFTGRQYLHSGRSEQHRFFNH